MKNLFLVCCILNFSMTSLLAQNPTEGQVWVIINYIKAASKADYEKWMTDIFFAPMKASQDPVLKKQFSTARWQKPVRQNEDKTWTYSIILDPAVPNADYDIEHFLSKTYGEAKSKTYMQQYESFMASAGQIHFFESNRATEPLSVKEEEDAIKKVIINETEMWLDQNRAAWSESFIHVPYLTWTVTNGGEPGDALTMRGWEALNSYMDKWFSNDRSALTKEWRKAKTTRDQWQIQIRGNVAYVSFNAHSDGEKQKMDMTETRVLERINGVWKIAMHATVGDFKDATPPIRSKY